MKISVIAASELDKALTEKWSQIQRNDDTLRSPYYCPEFTQLVSGARPHVRVAVLEDGGEVKGFFPFERDPLLRLHPVGMGLNDYHGLIAQLNLQVDARALLKACKAIYIGFNHMPLSQQAFAPYVQTPHVSPVLELNGGWDAYVKRLCVIQNTKSPGILSTIRASERRVERDIGPLRVVLHENSPQILEVLMRLKAEQWARTTGTSNDPFSVPWIRQVMKNALAMQGGQFGGVLSVLYAGDKLLALHFGLRATQTLHSWFPVYDLAYAYYQPGLILLKSIAEQGAATDFDLIDLGRGISDYKVRFKTATVPMGEGGVSRPAVLAQIAMAAQKTKACLKLNPHVRYMRQWVGKVKA
jgi:CelD/BcsL family acetyltransferase involved in cellulose biosynthesis